MKRTAASGAQNAHFGVQTIPTQFTIWLIAIMLTFAGSLIAQQASVDNFVHPPGTRTAPLGQLGHIEKMGEGSTDLILLPGAPFGWQVWENFMKRNADHYTMYAITPPGYAGTAPPPMPADTDEFSNRVWTDALIDAILELIESEEMERPVIVTNHLLSDYYGLRLALDHGDKVGAVVISAGTPSSIPPASIAGEFPTAEEQEKWVTSAMLPVYRNVTRETWNQNTYTPSSFTRDQKKGQVLYDEQISNPISTQLRYFLEFQTSTLISRMEDLKLPVLVIQPARSVNPAIQAALALGTPQKVIDEYIERKWGSREALAEALRIPPQWEPLRFRVAGLDIRYVDNTGLFAMHDQPQEFDQLLDTFIDSLPPKSAPLPAAVDLARGLALIEPPDGRIEIDYGRPKLAGREPTRLLQPGQVWRLGMNASTTLTTDLALEMADYSVEPGRYVLTISRTPDVWHLQVRDGQDVIAEVPLEVDETASPREVLTVDFEPQGQDHWQLRIQWGTLLATVGVEVGE